MAFIRMKLMERLLWTGFCNKSDIVADGEGKSFRIPTDLIWCTEWDTKIGEYGGSIDGGKKKKSWNLLDIFSLICL